MMHAVWNGTFYKDDGPNEWLYADGQPFYRAIVTDATGTTWTFEMPLQEKIGRPEINIRKKLKKLLTNAPLIAIISYAACPMDRARTAMRP